jgi:hypothetical protein
MLDQRDPKTTFSGCLGKAKSASMIDLSFHLGDISWLQKFEFCLLLKTFFVFRAVITEEFKVPDKMVGFSKYCLFP